MSARATSPTKLGPSETRRFLYLRRCMNTVRRLARERIDDADFDWRVFGEIVANDMIGFREGLYVPLGARRPISWPSLSPETILLYGREPVFARADDVPEWIFVEVAAGIADAQAHGHRPPFYNKRQRASRLGVDAGTKLRLRLWYGLGCSDVDEAGWRWLLRQRRNAGRRAKSARPHESCLSRQKPWEAAGISRATFYRLRALERMNLVRETNSGIDNSSICEAKICLNGSAAISTDAPSISGATTALVSADASIHPATIPPKEKSPMRNVIDARAAFLAAVVELGGAPDAPHVARAAADFAALAGMCEPPQLAALMTAENVAHAAHEALRLSPPPAIIAAAAEAWRAAAA